MIGGEVSMKVKVALMLSGLIAILLFFAACAPEPQTRLETQQVSTQISGEAASPLPVLTGTATPSTPPASGVAIQPALPASVRYRIYARLDWLTRTVEVQQHVTYRNTDEDDMTVIVFSVPPNRVPGQFTLTRLATEQQRANATYILDGARLTVPLEAPLPLGEETEFLLEYTLAVLPIGGDNYTGYLGYSARQVNLGLWFPVIAAHGSAWITQQFHTIGETAMLRTGDFDVRLQVENAPDSLRVAGPGQVSRPDDTTWRFELQNGREMALSVSDQFQTMQTSTETGIEVMLFYYSNGSLDTPRHALHTAADALTVYEELYGPCPFDRLVVVQGDFSDGMEFSGLVFVSGDWFLAWQGQPNDWLTLITAHEVAHQWWYALVGNDQSSVPYLDEALAAYSERLFIEQQYPDLVDWWWAFRVEPHYPYGYVDATVYEFDSVRLYINAVYLRGALMMEALRTDLGDDVFFAWLSEYAATMRGEVATPADWWGLLSDDDYAATADTRQSFLENPDVLPKK